MAHRIATLTSAVMSITAGLTASAYKSGIALALTYANKSYAVDSDIGPTTATLSGNRTSGTATGKALTGETLTAKFHC